jgi:hypothetical protein
VIVDSSTSVFSDIDVSVLKRGLVTVACKALGNSFELSHISPEVPLSSFSHAKKKGPAGTGPFSEIKLRSALLAAVVVLMAGLVA